MSEQDLMTDGQAIADVIRWSALDPNALADSIGDSIDRSIARAVASAFTRAATIADEVAEAHRKIVPQGRFTADYRAGAADAASHVAHLLRKAAPDAAEG